MDIFSGEFSDFVKERGLAKDASGRTIVIHLKRLCADNLEPMDERFDAGVGIEMGV